MLAQLSIRNYALIQHLEVSFDEGFTVITGETGAGKSIILGALGLLVGNRADLTVLKSTEEKCIIEGVFKLGKLKLERFFKKEELDYDEETIIRREILPSGKSRAFINDTPVKLNLLSQLGIQLIDIHSQHNTLALFQKEFQLEIVDSIAKNEKVLQRYSGLYTTYKNEVSVLQELKSNALQMQNDLDYFQFQFNEFEEIDLETTDQDQLELELKTLNSAEEIKTALESSSHIIDSESGLISQLQRIKSQLGKVDHPEIGVLFNRVESIRLESQDILNELEQCNDSIVFDQNRISDLQEILDVLYRLQRKHNKNSIAELVELKEEISDKILRSSNVDQDIQKQEQKVDTIFLELKALASELSSNRLSVVSKIENEVQKLLRKIAMSEAELKIELKEASELNSNGADEVEFLFKTNKGSAFKSIQKVASGGELSRLMFALKYILTKSKTLPTVIFDEIDTGISGEIAAKMGDLMKLMAKSTQICAITHLPQVAGKGDLHLKVFKTVKGDATETSMTALSDESRIDELAKMLSGDKLSDAAIENAKVLMN